MAQRAARPSRAPRRPGSARARAAFGTYVVFGTDVRCRIPATGLEWNPKKEVMILVLLTWGLEALTLCARPRPPAPARAPGARRRACACALAQTSVTSCMPPARLPTGFVVC